MSTVVINTFDGGNAEDLRTDAPNQCESSTNFDITSNSHKLIPYSDPIAETSEGAMTDDAITDVAAMSPTSGGTVNVYGMGRVSSAAQDVAIFKKGSTSDITSAWAQVATNSNTLTPGTMIEYKNRLFFLAGGTTWHRFADPSTITPLTTFGAGYNTNFAPRPFRHPDDDTVYFGIANRVYKFDHDFTYTTATLLHTLSVNQEITSFTEYGTYLAIATRYVNKTDKGSVVYLSNKKIPNSGTQMVIDWGEGSLVALENIGGVLVGVSYTENIGAFTTTSQYKMFIKIYSGGSVQTIKEINTNQTFPIRIWKAKSNNKMYFGFDTDNAVYVLGKNKAGEWYVSKNRYMLPSGSFMTGTLNGLSLLGDIMFSSYQDGGVTGYLARQGTGTAYTLTSRYITTINPKMPKEDRTKKKKLMSIRISYTVNTANGTVGVDLSKDGGAYATVISKAQTSTGEYVTHATNFNDGTNFDDCYEFQLRLNSTGNVSIKQVEYAYDNVGD